MRGMFARLACLIVCIDQDPARSIRQTGCSSAVALSAKYKALRGRMHTQMLAGAAQQRRRALQQDIVRVWIYIHPL